MFRLPIEARIMSDASGRYYVSKAPEVSQGPLHDVRQRFYDLLENVAQQKPHAASPKPDAAVQWTAAHAAYKFSFYLYFFHLSVLFFCLANLIL